MFIRLEKKEIFSRLFVGCCCRYFTIRLYGWRSAKSLSTPGSNYCATPEIFSVCCWALRSWVSLKLATTSSAEWRPSAAAAASSWMDGAKFRDLCITANIDVAYWPKLLLYRLSLGQKKRIHFGFHASLTHWRVYWFRVRFDGSARRESSKTVGDALISRAIEHVA